MDLFKKLFSGIQSEPERPAQRPAPTPPRAPVPPAAPRYTGMQPPRAPHAAASARPAMQYSLKNMPREYFERVPAEECQYNFRGTYIQYFEKVLREDFPMYRLTGMQIQNTKRYAFFLTRGASPELVIELMPESSSADKLRRDCFDKRIPYLRFYYDHRGWWNTRSYVRERVRRALNV